MQHTTKTGVVKKKWTLAEIEVIRNFYSEWGTKKCLSLLPGRTKVQIQSKARRLGIFTSSYSRFKEEAKNKKKCAQGANTIICFHCQKELPIKDFNDRGGKRKGQKKTVCKECESKRLQILRKEPRRFISNILSSVKSRQEDTKLTLDFLYELYLNQNKKCALTGIELTTITGKGRVQTNMSLDRIDSNLGYTEENVRWLCLWANTAKNDLPDEEFLKMCELTLN